VFITKLKGDEGWLESLRKRKKKRWPVSSVIRQSTRVFYFRAGRAVKIFGYVPDAFPCSSMVAKTWIQRKSGVDKETLTKGEKR
jgi:hypothetical protein